MNLKEVIEINNDETQKMGTFDQFLQDAGFVEEENIFFVRKELVGFSPLELRV